jgi:hypothetical protein
MNQRCAMPAINAAPKEDRTRSPCLAAPSIRFLFIGSQFMFPASFPHSVALMQLRFTSLVVINLRRDLHP